MTYQSFTSPGGGLIKSWTQGVAFDDGARQQLMNIAQLPFVGPWVAAMPDVHVGMGATIGSVLPTVGAIIPAAVGVDIGCGMVAVRTDVHARDLPDTLATLRSELERCIPHGRSVGRSKRDKGSWHDVPEDVQQSWKWLAPRFRALCDKHPKLAKSNHLSHLGTLGTGNHFIEVCLDEAERVWIMLHSGSRGVGNFIGMHFIQLAKKEMERHQRQLPDDNLAYLQEGSQHFADYVEAVGWAQDYARLNRQTMMQRSLQALARTLGKPLVVEEEAINCHHNYVQQEQHFGQTVWLTRKGAVSAQQGQLGIIPGSMGARSFIVRGKGNTESFCSCSHGAGRMMSRTEAKKSITLDQHVAATAHVECRKDSDVIDESPAAYKDIDAVMAAQQDLVEVVYTLRQVVCVKG
ncbi:RtcB family protein [Pokkaliibacter sp. MBI-7]|uniref:RtcB family protein n=1 Tax=Pokkaliibacter sp. MBI-7 TaxID=3040600 RepID=UPI002446E815|nr:RtcB family protein [Pokkaliibacter sp. MBI-7]MDH2431432.1 RtcB family protein [Pokkaliibacter sp. MBI-7]